MTQNQSEALDNPTMSFSDVVQLIRADSSRSRGVSLSYVEASKILDVAIYPHVYHEQSALLNRIEASLPEKRYTKTIIPGVGAEATDEEYIYNKALDDVKQILQQEREKL